MKLNILKKIFRISFGKIQNNKIPNLIKIQKKSYEDFLQFRIDKKNRKLQGLEKLFKENLNIISVDKNIDIKYCGYILEEPKYSPEACIERGVNYSAPLKVYIHIYVYENIKKKIKTIKKQEVYMGDVPLMTNNGTFIINGAKRVIVSQIHRSPGVFYYQEKIKDFLENKNQYTARIIPNKGAWLDFDLDDKNIVFFKIDKKKKLPVSTLLRCLKYKTENILEEFCKTKKILYKDKKYYYRDNIYNMIECNKAIRCMLAKNIKHPQKKRYYIYKAGEVINLNILQDIEKYKIKEFFIIDLNEDNKNNIIIKKTIEMDKNKNTQEALKEIYQISKNHELINKRTIQKYFSNIFFSSEKYDLSLVGRMKINKKHKLNINKKNTTLTKKDIIVIIKYLIKLHLGEELVDDIDSLSNRRIKTVGELIENQFQIGLIKMKKYIYEKIASIDIENIMPYEIINPKTIINCLREFFCLSQLSQFMDQTNPLSEITHKRRLSALGPGGLARDRAGFEVRDVHSTHYSRICPIETPEGKNIGLISSLATYAEINKYGFIESPYKEVKNGSITNKIVKITAIEEKEFYITRAGIETNMKGEILKEIVTCRKNGEIKKVNKKLINLTDISPQQVVSVASSLIPFLENNDANRALMGSNMLRQAVPLMVPEAPIIGTGMENIVAINSDTMIMAKKSGIVEQLDSSKILVRTDVIYKNKNNIPGINIYKMKKYIRSNQGTCINQNPIVNIKQKVKKGDLLADGSATHFGELALGKNILVAFMPWNGYNFEDSILISERLIKEDIYTSIHINEYETTARDTRLGPEEITKDLPNINIKKLINLDKIGIIKIGTRVESGDILVGKITPKNITPLTPEEKLLRAIFGEKTNNTKNSSLKVPSGGNGIVINIKIFTKRGIKKDQRSIIIENNEIKNFILEKENQIEICRQYIIKQINKKNIYSQKTLEQLIIRKHHQNNNIQKLITFYLNYKKNINQLYIRKIDKLKSGDDLPQGVLKIIKIYIASKIKIQTGDKMAGRHGNKGVVSKIISEEEMPYLDNGKIIDMILNPLGVPSRMNIGQIFETHLGWASYLLGVKLYNNNRNKRNKTKIISNIISTIKEVFNTKDINEIIKYLKKLNTYELYKLIKEFEKGVKFATPVFDGIKIDSITNILRSLNKNTSGQIKLRDGRTGEYFEKPITVGYMYMLKLDHLANNKIHARSIGPYSLVTQQPLGGKSHFGGQRFGEMECWALQAYGAAYTLQEMLTIKSDDVLGRVQAYETIIKNNNNFEIGLPESFKVMIKEIKALALNIELIKNKK